MHEVEQYKIPCVIFLADVLSADWMNRVKKPCEKLYFQIHIAEHCNLNCRGCYHFSSIAEEEYLDLEEYTKDIIRLSELFDGEMEHIMLLGGEPLLHPEIAEFLSVTRKYFPTGIIKILSNGILVPKLNQNFWDICVDTGTELWLTKYPINLDYDSIEKIARDHGTEIRYFSKEPIRTLGHQPMDIKGTRNYVDNFEKCYRSNACILLEHGKMYSCFVAAESRHFSKFFNLDLEICEQDYVDIYAVKSGKELLEKLTIPTPFCRYCNRDDVSVFGRIPWEITRRSIEEWIE